MSHLFPSHYSALHTAALDGDYDAVRRALESGADVNAYDEEGRSVLMCAVAGPSWDLRVSHMDTGRLSTIRALIEHPNITLYSLNASDEAFDGFTPLGMASWLNQPEAVSLLLRGSLQTVSVDGLDAQAATPLMYAARGGYTEVAVLLLSHGARPDFRDRDHKTSVQFATAHPQVLYLCELVLRYHRYRQLASVEHSEQSQNLLRLCASALPPSTQALAPPASIVFLPNSLSRVTDILKQYITSSDVSFLYSVLFSPFLPSTSPASRYPLSCPLLVNQSDENGWSPIHHCAIVSTPSVEILNALYCAGADVSLFTTQEQFTALHCLARSYQPGGPESVQAMCSFVWHLVAQLRAPLGAIDTEDETPLHIAAEHGHCLELVMILLECDLNGDVKEMRNARGLTALEVCRPEFLPAFGEDVDLLRCRTSLSQHTIRPMSSFVSITPAVGVRSDAEEDNESLISDDIDISTACLQLLSNLRSTSIPSLSTESNTHEITNMLNESEHLCTVILDHFRTKTGEASKVLAGLSEQVNSMRDTRDRVSVLAHTKLMENNVQPLRKSGRVTRGSQDSDVTIVSELETPPPSETVYKRERTWSVSAKLKGFFKRSLSPQSPSKGRARSPPVVEEVQENIEDLDEEEQVEVTVIAENTIAWSVQSALSSSTSVLQAAMVDLEAMLQMLDPATRLVQKSEAWISRVERLMQHALRSRRDALEALHLHDEDSEDDDLFLRRTPSQANLLSSPSYLSPYNNSTHGLPSMSASSSARSSFVSLLDTLEPEDDQETRAIRRFVLRKIDAAVSGAVNDADFVDSWLRIVKESVRGVQRRAYL